MPRAALPPGRWGRITSTQRGPRQWRARAYYRDYAGVRRLVEANGPTATQAEAALLDKLHEMSAGQTGGVVAITAETRMNVAFDEWWRERQLEGELTLQSFDTYGSNLRTHLRPALGNLRVREVTPVVVNRLLAGISLQGKHDVARQSRNILTQVMAMCVRYGAVSVNPVRDAAPVRRSRGPREIRTLALDQIPVLRKAVREWEDRPAKRGVRNITLLPQIVDTMLGTGLRIGECLALREGDVQLDGDAPTLTVHGTVVRVAVRPAAEGEPARRQLVRQAKPKSDSSRRTVTLPPFVVVALREALDLGLDGGPDRLVFPSTRGTPRSPSRVREQLREALEGTGVTVRPHDFRRTVASLLDAELDTKTAAAQLGHSTEATTLRHYVKRTHVAPDVRVVLDLLVTQPDADRGNANVMGK